MKGGIKKVFLKWYIWFQVNKKYLWAILAIVNHYIFIKTFKMV